MYGLDLFSGIGGITLALQDWVKPIAYCEADKYAQSVLLSRISDGTLPNAPIWDDVQTLRGEMLPTIDIIYGGFPCQDISVAGRGEGLEGKRSGLFYEIIRLSREIRPSFVFLENVPAIRTRGLEQVIKAFTEIGYDCRWTCVSASSVGANHKRERWFLLAYADCVWQLSKQDTKRFASYRASDCGKNVPYTHGKGLQGQREESFGIKKKFDHACYNSWWTVEPSVGRVAHGVQNRPHRIKALGNAVVPLQVRTAFMELLGVNL